MTKEPMGPKEKRLREMKEEKFNSGKGRRPSAAELRKSIAKVNRQNVRPTGRGR